MTNNRQRQKMEIIPAITGERKYDYQKPQCKKPTSQHKSTNNTINTMKKL